MDDPHLPATDPYAAFLPTEESRSLALLALTEQGREDEMTEDDRTFALNTGLIEPPDEDVDRCTT